MRDIYLTITIYKVLHNSETCSILAASYFLPSLDDDHLAYNLRNVLE